jgi:hypothetical protein
MEADMHDLVPALGEVNQYRSNLSVAELPGLGWMAGDGAPGVVDEFIGQEGGADGSGVHGGRIGLSSWGWGGGRLSVAET